ncbi:hypothetical protein FNF29_03395 [Cafeteria roenbergensis]|uniref:Uncharacterized protein n=1 Tax=Cafeteria roenbergensis TaxID=33653 RepID=A0A5A8CL20_CAFRO|nr:hypothetical protein FNF29_03395 [Cafeteria roenbergensis]|eukprot:KAA0153207.1 hypothetical protein FNF29_03395 [Cafeteria roenbergensis]
MRALSAVCIALLGSTAAAVDLPFNVVVSSAQTHHAPLIIEVGPMARLVLVGNATVEQVDAAGEEGNVTATEVPRATLALGPESALGADEARSGTGCGRPWHATLHLVPEDLAAAAASVERNETARPWPVQPPGSTPIVGRGAAVGGRFRLSVLTCGTASVRVQGVARVVWPAAGASSWPPSAGPLGGDGVVSPYALAGLGVLVPLGPAMGHGLAAAPAPSAAGGGGGEPALAGFRWVHTSPTLESEPAVLVMEAASHALLLLLWLTWTLVPGCFARTDYACRGACRRCAALAEGSPGHVTGPTVAPTLQPLDAHAIGVFQRRRAAAEAVVAAVALLAVATALAKAVVLTSASAGESYPEWVLFLALLSSAVRPLMLVASSSFFNQTNHTSAQLHCCGVLAVCGGAMLDLACGLAEVLCVSVPQAMLLRQVSADEASCTLPAVASGFVSGLVGTGLAILALADLIDLGNLQASLDSPLHFHVIPLRLRALHLRTLGLMVPAGQAVGAILIALTLDWRDGALSTAAFAAGRLGWWATLLFVVRPDPGVPGSGLSSVLADCLQPGLRAARESRLRGCADGLLLGASRLLCHLACGACCCCYAAHDALSSPFDLMPTRRSGGHGGFRGWKLAAASGELGALDAMRRSGGVVHVAPAEAFDGDTD